MRSSLWVATFVTACGFSSSTTPSSPDGIVPVDSAVDTPNPDARLCFGSGMGMVCLTAAPTQPLTLGSADFDTGAGSCTEVVSIAGTPICVLAGTTVALPAETTFRARGSRPLLVIASTTISIDGTLSVASQRGLPPGAGVATAGCAAAAPGENDGGGGGGGAGGSFASAGGTGGAGDLNSSHGGSDGSSLGGEPVAGAPPSIIRAGCRGGNGGSAGVGGTIGAGGDGGGAIYLSAGTSITVAGSVRATGAGGGGSTAQHGGGGGGSGGFAGFDAPQITITGSVSANGGGGGEGGGLGTQVGVAGTDGDLGPTRARGGRAATGDGGANDGGNGGSGGAGAMPDPRGESGQSDNGGGGGGGGGVGYVYVKGALSGGGAISPPAAVF